MNSQLPNDEEARREHWAHRIEEMKRKKKRQEKLEKVIRRAGVVVLGVFLIGIFIFAGKKLFHKDGNDTVKAAGAMEKTVGIAEEPLTQAVKQDSEVQLESEGTQSLEVSSESEDSQEPVTDQTSKTGFSDNQTSFHAERTGATAAANGEVISNYAVLIDFNKNQIVAARNENARINPASMTKILSVLVAAEHVTSLEDTFTITTEITDYSYVNDCSNAGFEDGETVTVKDLFYGSILPSGGEATLALATYVAGSQEAFVELMNEKARELGIADSAHFTNCIGIYDENHYCTAYDMAVILQAAINNDLCREVLSTHTYTTSSTTQHPEGITISNWFLRRIEDKDSGGEVICGKTGYVVQSGNCAASYAEDKNGKGYICVTADATSGWRCIYDHVAIYKEFLEN